MEEAIESAPANQEDQVGSNYSNDAKKPNLLEQGLSQPGTDAKVLTEMEEQSKGKPLRRERNQRIWSDWFKSLNFWKICVIYMLSRLYVNVTQVYTPLYLQDTLKLAKVGKRFRCYPLNQILYVFKCSAISPLCHSSHTLPALSFRCFASRESSMQR